MFRKRNYRQSRKFGSLGVRSNLKMIGTVRATVNLTLAARESHSANSSVRSLHFSGFRRDRPATACCRRWLPETCPWGTPDAPLNGVRSSAPCLCAHPCQPARSNCNLKLVWLQCLRCRVKLTLHNKAVANSVSEYVHLTGNVCFRICGILPKSSNLVGSGTTPWAITGLRKGR